jgi:[acyl-carrier-protein] S-malonyltransferase
MKTAFIFPGQGSQYVEMGKSLGQQYSLAKEVFQEADEALGFSLSQLILNGPNEELTQTQNTQPAILTTSIAYYRVLAQEFGVKPDLVAGHSLGEFSALVAAGTLDLANACRLVRNRGKFMQEAVPAGQGAMAAFIGLTAEKAQELLDAVVQEEPGILAIAGCNSPGQIVLSGHAQLVSLACEKAKNFGSRRATLLNVSAPFHCPLMTPAEEKLSPLLRDTPFQDLQIPYVANANGQVISNSEEIVSLLLQQVCLPVLWQQTIEKMWESGIRCFVEVGPGNVLSGLVKRCLSIFAKEDVKEAIIHISDQDSGIAPFVSPRNF